MCRLQRPSREVAAKLSGYLAYVSGQSYYFLYRLDVFQSTKMTLLRPLRRRRGFFVSACSPSILKSVDAEPDGVDPLCRLGPFLFGAALFIARLKRTLIWVM